MSVVSRRRCLIATAQAAILAASGISFAAEPKVDVREAIEGLRSEDRAVRIGVARILSREASLPAALGDPAVDFIKKEIAHAFVPQDLPDAKRNVPIIVPSEPEAVTPARIMAQPETYIGANFVMVGLLEVSDYYNFGYSNASNDYYSLLYRPVNAKGQSTDQYARLYLPRSVGKSLVDRITRVAEDDGNRRLLARMECTIDPGRCEGKENATESIRIKDWQYLAPDGKSWTPGAYEGVQLGFDILLKTGSNANQKCVDLITAESAFQSEDADTILRRAAVIRILDLPKSQRQLILRWLPNRVKRAKSARAKMWGTRTYDSLLAGRMTF